MTTAGASSRISEIYAGPLFELAAEAELVDAVKTDLDMIAELLAGESSLGLFLSSPYFPEDEKADLLGKVLSEKLNNLTLDFLLAVLRHNRMRFLADIIDRYDQLRDSYRGCHPVAVTVSKPLSEDQQRKLSADLAGALRCQVRLEQSVDPSILGGVSIRYADRVVDNSVKARLTRAVHEITNRRKGAEDKR